MLSEKSIDIHILGAEKIDSFQSVYSEKEPSKLTMNQIRREYTYPTIEEVVANVREKIRATDKSAFDYLTICGQGEPLLHPQATEIIMAIIELRNQEAPHAKVAIVTNGAHINTRKLINALNSIDERIVQLDAGNASILKKVNSPLIRLTVDRLVQDVKKLKTCTIQTTFIEGAVTNTSPEHLEDWLEVVGMIQPTQLVLRTPKNAIWRKDIEPVSEDTLETIASRVRRRHPSIEIRVLTR